MKKTLIASLVLFVVLFGFSKSIFASDPIDVSSLEKLPVQYSGRIQPLESLAIDLAEAVYGRKVVAGHSALSFLLELMSQPDIWHEKPIVKVDYHPLKEQAGLDVGQKYFSMAELGASEGVNTLFSVLLEKSEKDEQLLPLDRKVQSVRNALLMLDAVLTGEILQMVPPEAGTNDEWLSIRELAEHPSERNVAILGYVRNLMDAYVKKDQAGFDQGAIKLMTTLKEINPAVWNVGWKLDVELAYHDWQPFRFSWIFYLLSGILLVAGWRLEKNFWNQLGLVAFVIGFLFHTLGLTMRVLVLGRPPVSNMYESIVFMSWMVSVFALIFVFIWRQMLFINVSAFVGAAILIMGSLMPFDPSLDVLVPVLRSNYWLTIHVLTIVSSYGAFALAMGVGHLTLGYFIWSPRATGKIRDLAQLTYRCMQVGVILLAAGTILGGVWANESWGRFWGWDPKETWALIALLGYLALLHARYVGWVREFGLAMGSVLCFMLIIMTWYGVNFVLGRGLHSYGFGAGGGHWMIGYLVLEAAYLTLAWKRSSKVPARV